MKFYQFITIVFFTGIGSILTGADWSRWKGPSADGFSQETGWTAETIDQPDIKWQKEIGIGYSAVSVADNRLFAMGSIEQADTTMDVVYCLEPQTGKEIWRYSYSCPRGQYPGPRAMPVVNGSRVYTLSRDGHVFCFKAADGSVLWKRHLREDFGCESITWGFAGAPLVFENMVILNAGTAGIALNGETGDKVWFNGPGKAGYAAPVLFERNGDFYVAILSDKMLYLVNAWSGKIWWTYDWIDKYEVYAADPTVVEGKLFLSSSNGRQGCVLFDIAGETPQLVWQSRVLRNIFAYNIFQDGYLYGVDGDTGPGAALKCVSLETGEEMWNQQLGFGTLLAAGQRLLFLSEKGKLLVLKMEPDGFVQLAGGEILNKPVCWTPPVLANGLLYARNNPGTLVCVVLGK
ncbi:PQQ-like beta-propeller repeat protein [candidate division KSB1 bacterium]|nr:PQQ-like beta-propeller repeat protein [candidate division KSB1 bacterium]